MNRLIPILLLALSGCAASRSRVIPVSTKSSTEIISEPPGARIEINNDYVGDAPLHVEIAASKNIYGVVIDDVVVVANPVVSGQYRQVKHLLGQQVPKRMYFDMNMAPAPNKHEIGFE